MSQSELARSMGVDKVTVWRIEKGKVTPTLDTLQSLSVALQVSMQWLATGRDAPKRTSGKRAA
jgi:transcriptional regulator with XRE-family HTH domain